MAHSKPQPNLASLQRHPEYYLLGGDLHFIVENYRFRIHRYFFERESTYFQDRLSVPAIPGAQPEGTSELNAILLPDIRAVDFERFLWVFYNPTYSLYDATIADWTTILHLAHKWRFPEVAALAVRELEKADIFDIDRIVLYHKYEVDETILVPYYAALCAREQTITYDEGLKLGLETALKLARARECARSEFKSKGGRSPLPDEFKMEDMGSLITDVFELGGSRD